MNKRNADIKTLAKEKNVKLWQVADKIGLQESNFSKMLRYPLSVEEKEKIFTIINEIADEEV